MHRPVMSREVGFLVKALVKLSEWLNTQLKLDQPVQAGETAETVIQVQLSEPVLNAHVNEGGWDHSRQSSALHKKVMCLDVSW